MTRTGNISIEEARHQIGTSMMAWRVHEFGPPETMQFERVPVPTPGPGEVLVKVHAAGVGPWDGWIRGGRSALPQPLPLTLGSDLSGEIEALGPDVTGLRIGDQVYGVTNPRFIGAYAEYALASAAMIARKPASLSYIEAASVPVIAVTAWQGLFDQAQLTAGQTVLIHGAAETLALMRCRLPAVPASDPSRRQARTISPMCASSGRTRWWISGPSVSRTRPGMWTPSLISSAAKRRTARSRSCAAVAS